MYSSTVLRTLVGDAGLARGYSLVGPNRTCLVDCNRPHPILKPWDGYLVWLVGRAGFAQGFDPAGWYHTTVTTRLVRLLMGGPSLQLLHGQLSVMQSAYFALLIQTRVSTEPSLQCLQVIGRRVSAPCGLAPWELPLSHSFKGSTSTSLLNKP